MPPTTWNRRPVMVSASILMYLGLGAAEVKDMYDVLEVIELPIFPWHAAPKPRYMRIDADTITGRRFHVVGGTTTSEGSVPDDGSMDQT